MGQVHFVCAFVCVCCAARRMQHLFSRVFTYARKRRQHIQTQTSKERLLACQHTRLARFVCIYIYSVSCWSGIFSDSVELVQTLLLLYFLNVYSNRAHQLQGENLNEIPGRHDHRRRHHRRHLRFPTGNQIPRTHLLLWHSARVCVRYLRPNMESHHTRVIYEPPSGHHVISLSLCVRKIGWIAPGCFVCVCVFA